MEIHDCPAVALDALKGAELFTHGHLPIAAAYCRALGLAEMVDRLVPT